MVTAKNMRRERGWLTAEAAVAMAVVISVLLPLLAGFAQNRGESRDLYVRAVAMEIVDGEMEVLAAGAWREFAPGRHTYTLDAAAMVNLPEGEFVFTRAADFIRLEWLPDHRLNKTPVRREMKLP